MEEPDLPQKVNDALAILKKTPFCEDDKFGDILTEVLVTCWNEMSWEQLGEAVNQILTHLNSNYSHYKLAVEKICVTLNQCEDRLLSSGSPLDDFREARATIILHLVQRCAQTAEFGKALINVIKTRNNELLVRSFNMGLLLSLVYITRYAEPALVEIKSALMRVFRETQHRNNCVWLNEKMPDAVDFRATFRNLLQCPNSELADLVGGGLCELGFVLLDTNINNVKVVDGHLLQDDEHLTFQQAACVTGKWILMQCVEKQRDTISLILERLFDAILDHARKDTVLYYIELLTWLVSKKKMDVAQELKCILSVLRSSVQLPQRNATALMKALLPIVKQKPELRNELFTILKHTMFHIKCDAAVAVNGFLLFLKHFNFRPQHHGDTSVASQSFPTFSSSQFSQSSFSQKTRRTFDSICLEAICCLKRCLTQRIRVRRILYKGLLDAASRNPHLLDPITDFLFRHACEYIDLESNAPVALDKAVQIISKKALWQEPLGELLQALLRCVLLQYQEEKRMRAENALDYTMTQGTSFMLSQMPDERNNEPVDQSVTFDKQLYSNVKKTLSSLAKSMTDADLEDFKINKDSNFAAGETEGSKNSKKVVCLLTVYEALIESSVWLLLADRTTASADYISNLHDKRKKVQEFMKDKNVTMTKAFAKQDEAAKNKNKNKKLNAARRQEQTDASKPILLMKTLNRCLTKLFFDNEDSWDACLGVLRQNVYLMHWMFDVCMEKVKLCEKEPNLEGSVTFDLLCRLASNMLRFYCNGDDLVACWTQSPDDHLKVMAIQIYSKILQIVAKNYPDQMKTALTHVWDEQNTSTSTAGESTLPELCLKHLIVFGKRFSAVRSQDEEETRKIEAAYTKKTKITRDQKLAKDAIEKQQLALVRVWETLIDQLPRDSDEFQKAFDSTEKYCLNKTFGSLSVVREFYKLYFSLHIKRSTVDMKILRVIAQNIARHSLVNFQKEIEEYDHLDDENLSQPSEPSKLFVSIDSRTVCVVSQQLGAHLQQRFATLKKAIEKLKTPWYRNTSKGPLECTVRNVIEESIDVMTEIVNTRVPHGDYAMGDARIKSLTAYFDAVNAYAVDYMDRILGTKGKQCNLDFRRLMCRSVRQVNSVADTYGRMNKEDARQRAELTVPANRARLKIEGRLFVALTKAKSTYEANLGIIAKRTIDDDQRLYNALQKVGQPCDFKIDFPKLLKALEKKRKADESDDDIDGTRERDSPSPPPARAPAVKQKKKASRRSKSPASAAPREESRVSRTESPAPAVARNENASNRTASPMPTAAQKENQGNERKRARQDESSAATAPARKARKSIQPRSRDYC